MRGTRSIGMILLSIWLILTGLMAFVDLASPGVGTLLSVLAIAAGVLILLGR